MECKAERSLVLDMQAGRQVVVVEEPGRPGTAEVESKIDIGLEVEVEEL